MSSHISELIFLTLELNLMADLPDDGVFDLFLDILPLAFKKMPKLANKKLLLNREVCTPHNKELNNNE